MRNYSFWGRDLAKLIKLLWILTAERSKEEEISRKKLNSSWSSIYRNHGERNTSRKREKKSVSRRIQKSWKLFFNSFNFLAGIILKPLLKSCQKQKKKRKNQHLRKIKSRRLVKSRLRSWNWLRSEGRTQIKFFKFDRIIKWKKKVQEDKLAPGFISLKGRKKNPEISISQIGNFRFLTLQIGRKAGSKRAISRTTSFDWKPFS